MTYHRWVTHERVPDYLRLGWMALPSLEGTRHGYWSAHCIWVCGCKMIEPPKQKEADLWAEAIANGPANLHDVLHPSAGAPGASTPDQ